MTTLSARPAARSTRFCSRSPDLAAGPFGLVRDGLAWGSDFTGPGREMVGAVRDFGTGGSFTGLWRTARNAADRVTEADILALYRNHPAEVATRALEDYRRARQAADRQASSTTRRLTRRPR